MVFRSLPRMLAESRTRFVILSLLTFYIDYLRSSIPISDFHHAFLHYVNGFYIISLPNLVIIFTVHNYGHF